MHWEQLWQAIYYPTHPSHRHVMQHRRPSVARAQAALMSEHTAGCWCKPKKATHLYGCLIWSYFSAKDATVVAFASSIFCIRGKRSDWLKRAGDTTSALRRNLAAGGQQQLAMTMTLPSESQSHGLPSSGSGHGCLYLATQKQSTCLPIQCEA